MVLQATFYAMVSCRIRMYSFMGWSPTDSIDATAGGYSHSLIALCVAVILVILRVAR